MRLYALAMIALTGAATNASAEHSFTLWNKTDMSMTELFAKPWNNEVWFGNILTEAVAPGYGSSLGFPDDGECVYDFRMTFEDGSRAVTQFNVCDQQAGYFPPS